MHRRKNHFMRAVEFFNEESKNRNFSSMQGFMVGSTRVVSRWDVWRLAWRETR